MLVTGVGAEEEGAGVFDVVFNLLGVTMGFWWQSCCCCWELLHVLEDWLFLLNNEEDDELPALLDCWLHL